MRIEENYSLKSITLSICRSKTRWFMEYAEWRGELGLLFYMMSISRRFVVYIGSGSNLLFINDSQRIIPHSAIKGITLVKETDDHAYLRRGEPPSSGSMKMVPRRKGGGGTRTRRYTRGRCCRYPKHWRATVEPKTWSKAWRYNQPHSQRIPFYKCRSPVRLPQIAISKMKHANDPIISLLI